MKLCMWCVLHVVCASNKRPVADKNSDFCFVDDSIVLEIKMSTSTALLDELLRALPRVHRGKLLVQSKTRGRGTERVNSPSLTVVPHVGEELVRQQMIIDKLVLNRFASYFYIAKTLVDSREP